MITEGHAFGTGASLWGDIPYSEAGNSEIEDPIFDSQISVYNAAIAILDEGISTLNGATSTPLDENIYFNGDKDKWIAAANTLKARFYLHQKDYSNVLSAAQNGISSANGDMKYKPGDAVSGDTNLFWTILAGSRAGDIGNNSEDGTESYLLQILDASNALSRNHAKTDETARRAYYMVDADNTHKPERMPYAQNELNSNSNVPAEDLGIFTKTEVNR